LKAFLDLPKFAHKEHIIEQADLQDTRSPW